MIIIKLYLFKSTFQKCLLAYISVLMISATSCSKVNTAKESSESVSQDTEQSVSQSVGNGEDVVITIAMVMGDNEMEKMIEDFNAIDNGYQIVPKYYGKDPYDEDGMPIGNTEEEVQQRDFRLIQDLINKDDIDIVYSGSFGNSAKHRILQNKGAFANLYSFMDGDDEVNIDTLNQHILSLNEIDGKLYSLPTYYTVQTLIGSTKYVGDKENWTFDDFILHWEEMPEGSTISGTLYAEYIYSTVLRGNLEAFVDYKNAQVHFNSPEFKKMLEFCGQFESNGYQKSDYDYDAPNFVFDKTLNGIMSSKYFKDISDPHSLDDGAPYTMVGYPSLSGEGAYFLGSESYSICSKSSLEKQKGAWEFIRTFVTEDYQISNTITKEEFTDEFGNAHLQYFDEIGFCINNNAFNRIADDIIAGKYYSPTYEDKGVEYTFELPMQEDVDKLINYLDSIDRWETNIDRALWQIINDETLSYFAGENSLENTISMIQDRASIWISEQC